MAILSQADPATGIWKGSAGTLAIMFNLSPRTCRDDMEKLEKKGYLKRFLVAGRHTLYPVLVHNYECSTGAMNGKRLNAMESKSCETPIYDGCHESAGASAATVPERVPEVLKEVEKKRKEQVLFASSDKTRSLPLEQEPTVFELPLVDGTEYGVPQKLYGEYVKAYPGVTVMAQLSKMRTWLLSNPTRRKTRKGITRAINSWLSRAQDSSGRTGYLPLPEMEPRKPTAYEKDRDAFTEELQKRKQEMGVNYGG